MVDYFAYIDDYVNGQLDNEALKAFEEEMKRNISLKQAVENYPTARDLSEGLLEIDMIETLNRLQVEKHGNADEPKGNEELTQVAVTEKRVKRRRAKSKRDWSKWIAAATLIGVLSTVGWWLVENHAERSLKMTSLRAI